MSTAKEKAAGLGAGIAALKITQFGFNLTTQLATPALGAALGVWRSLNA